MTRYRHLILLPAAMVALSGCFGSGAAKLSEQQRHIIDLNERALASSGKGYHDDAQRLLQEALLHAASLDDTAGQVATLLNQARLARRQNNLKLADKLVDQALKQADGSSLYADAAHEKAVQAVVLKQLDTAEKWATTALQSEKGELAGRRLNLQARIALLQGLPDKAMDLAEKAHAANRDDKLQEERANSLRIIGQVKVLRRQYVEAAQAAEQALVLDKQLGLPVKIASDLDLLAEIAGLEGKQGMKEDFLYRARLVREALRSQNKTGTPPAGDQPTTTRPSSKP